MYGWTDGRREGGREGGWEGGADRREVERGEVGS